MPPIYIGKPIAYSVAVALLVLLFLSGPRGPDPAQAIGLSGHGGSASQQLTVVGQLEDFVAGPGHISDVWALGNYAYLGSFDEPECSLDFTGVHIIDITDPTNPVKVGFIRSPPDLRANDVKAAHIETPFFAGDILVHSNEPCFGKFHPRTVADDAAGPEIPDIGDFFEAANGVSIYDVTNPAKPKSLRRNFLNFPVHNTYIHQVEDQALLLVVSDDRFFGTAERDFYIVDISRPRSPRVLSVTGAPDWALEDEQLGGFRIAGLHDVWAQTYSDGPFDGKTIAYLSYWDAGLVLLDISDPTTPVFLGDSDYQGPDPLSSLAPEGNSHAAVPNADGSLVFMGDEDFSPFQTALSVDTGFFADQYEAVEGAFTKPIADLTDQEMDGPTTFVGLACDGDPIPTPTGALAIGQDEEFIAVIERGVCRFDEKISNVAGAGYGGVVVFGRLDAPDEIFPMGGDPALGTIPAVMVTRFTGFAILGIDPASPADAPLPPVGTAGQHVTASQVFDGWGYGRILDVSDPANIVELGQYATENVLADPVPLGDHTMHNVIARDHRAYISWYADGIRVVDFTDPASPTEVAHFIDSEGSNFWGVYLHDHPDGNTYILGSDRDSGLWIFEVP